MGRGHWDADVLREVVREHVVEHLDTEDGVLVIDETGFLKKGQASCGMGQKYTGSAGKIMNCQIGVFATYVSARGHAFVDLALYTSGRIFRLPIWMLNFLARFFLPSEGVNRLKNYICCKRALRGGIRSPHQKRFRLFAP